MTATQELADVGTATPTRMGNFSYDTDTGLWDWDDQVFHILGLRPWSVTPTIEHMLSCTDPASRARICEGLLRAETQGEPFHLFYSLNAADGIERRVLIVGEPASTTDTHARPAAGINGYYIDLTEDFGRESVEVARQAVKESAQHRATIEQAVGGLMVAYGLNADQAFEMLRWWSQDRNVKVRDLAALLTDAASRGTTSDPAIRTTFDSLLHDLTTQPPSRVSSTAQPLENDGQPSSP